MEVIIVDNIERSRFETEINGEFAFLDYEFYNGAMALVHTFVPPKYRHKGIAFAIIKFALEYAKREQLKIIAGCSSVTIYIEQYPEYAMLLEMR
jgi:predicted GNAT family acetyltransferase